MNVKFPVSLSSVLPQETVLQITGLLLKNYIKLYHNPKPVLFTIYPKHGNLLKVP